MEHPHTPVPQFVFFPPNTQPILAYFGQIRFSELDALGSDELCTACRKVARQIGSREARARIISRLSLCLRGKRTADLVSMYTWC